MTSTTEVEDTDVNCDVRSLDEPVATSNNIPTNGGREVKIKYITSKSRKIKNRQLTNKITLMFLLITIVFLLSYVPKVILLIIEGISPYFWEQLSNTQRPGIIFLYQMFIMISVLPVLYLVPVVCVFSHIYNFLMLYVLCIQFYCKVQ
jgi:flagellar biosynthesis protein FlhB